MSESGRFVKSLLWRNYPDQPGLSTQEQLLVAAVETLNTLKRELPLNRARPARVTPTNTITISPSRDLSPQLQDLAYQLGTIKNDGSQNLHGQADIARLLAEQSQQGKQLLRQGDAGLDLLVSLDAVGRERVLQGIKMIEEMSSVRSVMDDVGSGVKELNLTALGIQGQGKIQISELRKHTSALDKIAALEGLQLASSNRLETGIGNLHAQSVEQTAVMKQVRDGINRLNLIAESSAHEVEHIRDTLDSLHLIAGRIYEVLNGISIKLDKPETIRARNIIINAERSRKVGDTPNALRQFATALEINPTDPLGYYSLGLMCLQFGATNAAFEFFVTGYEYSQGQSPDIRNQYLLRMGNILSTKRLYPLAIQIYEAAYEANKNDLYIWYLLALANMRMGSRDNSLYCLKHIIKVIKANPSQTSLLGRIRNTAEFQGLFTTLGI